MKTKALLAVAFGVGFLLPACADTTGTRARVDKDQRNLEDLPEAVQTAVRQEVGDGQIKEIEYDEHMGQPVYEVEYFTADGAEVEVDVSPQGQISDRHDD